VQVHWAETPAEANAIMLGIARHGAAKLIVKGKSMVSEEIELNHHMDAARHGLPGIGHGRIHRPACRRAAQPHHHAGDPQDQAADRQLFADKIPDTPYTEDVDALIASRPPGAARALPRRRHRRLGRELHGRRDRLAVLVENEGNGRMCTTVPEVHIAITGIEKVVEKLEHVMPLFSLLTRSATGQAVTTYFNVITGPRREGELDGPKEVHLVLLDNGRSQAWRDADFRATLQCIRCGACMNHCPVYTRIGGHAYGTTYPGPDRPDHLAAPAGAGADPDLPTASSLCGACGEVCPVKIPIPDNPPHEG
jgi:L-lactate dehydrogenase complex protein LldF